MNAPGLSAAFPFEARHVEVHSARMHYVEEGDGEPVLFLHGNPTWSYLWRNVIPHVSPVARCIAPDLIGMGRSAKPDIDYRFVDHARYLEGFIDALGLENITLVIHDWGSALGFDYAFRHEERIRAIAFMEAMTRPVSWKEQTFITRWLFRRLRHPVKGRRMVMERNFFVEKALPMLSGRRLTQEEMEHYREPYRDEASRKPVMVWPREIPFDGDPPDVHERVSAYAERLRASSLPKLLLWVKPGLIITPREVVRLRSELTNLKDVYLGPGKHFIQEQHPDQIGRHVAEWYRDLP